MKAISMAVWALLLAACNTPPTPPPPPPPPLADSAPPPATDAAPSSTCAQACAALKTASCPMGSDLECPGLMQTMDDQGKQANPANGNKPLRCADVLAVKTKADAQKLGFVCQ